MKKFKFKLIALILTLSLFSNSLTAFAHSGKTDSSGGHKDNKNASGLGSYHYHHGEDPHLHPGGVCVLDTSATSAAQDEAYKQQIAKDTGYDTGYNDALAEKTSNASSYSSSYPSDFSEGYSLGYSKGAESLATEKASVTEIAKNNGYKDGYSGTSNQSSSYSDKYASVYKTQYDKSHKEGSEKRSLEISDTKSQGESLGLEDGYNKTFNESLDYTGAYVAEFTAAYKYGYSKGEQKLSEDILKHSTDSYINGLKNEKLDDSAYDNAHIQKASLESNEKALTIFNTFIKDVPMLGSSLADFSLYADGSDNIKIGTTDINDSTFISIDNSSKRKVNSVNFFINAIEENGYTKEATSSLIESFLKKDFLDSYTTKSSYQRTNDESTYDIYNLTTNNKISKSSPKKISIITVSKDNMVQEILISPKEPKYIKKYTKVTK